MNGEVPVDHDMGSEAVEVLLDLRERGDAVQLDAGECNRCHLQAPRLFQHEQVEDLCDACHGGCTREPSTHVSKLCIRCFSETPFRVAEESCW